MTRRGQFILTTIAAIAAYGCLAFWTGLPLFTGNLYSTDDYMRMSFVQALLSGHYTPFYTSRIGVAGSAMHWSPLLDWVYASIIWGLQPVAGLEFSTLILGTFIPLLLLWLFFQAMATSCRPVMPPGAAPVVNVAALLCFLYPTLTQFSPGYIDHHSWQIVLLTIAHAFVIGIYVRPERTIYAAGAGAAMALSLSISAEILPWIVLESALLFLFWLCDPVRYEWACRNLSLFGASFTMLLYPLFGAGPLQNHETCERFSIPFVAGMAVLAVFWMVLRFLPASAKQTIPKRLLASILIALPFLCLLYLAFPGCFAEPMASLPPEARHLWLDHVVEARPIGMKLYDAFWTTLLIMLYAGTAIAGCLYQILSVRRDVPLWLGHLIIITIGFAGSFWQYRVLTFAMIYTIMPIALIYIPLMRSRLHKDICLLVLAALIFAIGYLSWNEKKEWVAIDPPNCDLKEVTKVLKEQGPPKTILAFVDHGPELVMRTQHRAIAAPYNWIVDDIVLAHTVLASGDDEKARRLVASSKADMILVCRWELAGVDIFAHKNKNHFARRLFEDKAPDWLEKVSPDDPRLANARLYKVKKPL